MNDLLKMCNGINCDALISVGSRFCDPCNKKRFKNNDFNARGRISDYNESDRKFYKSALWLRIRKVQLRKEPFCRTCAKFGRKIFATLVDHITPLSKGGNRTKSDNLQSMCDLCHNIKRQKESMMQKEIEEGLVTIVCGPPGSGKTSYVLKNKRDQDLVIDLDALWSAITLREWYFKPQELLKYVLFVNERLIDALAMYGDVRAWVILQGASKQVRQQLKKRLKATVIVFEVDPYKCYLRIRKDTRRANQADRFRSLAKDWWGDYEKDEEDIIFKDS